MTRKSWVCLWCAVLVALMATTSLVAFAQVAKGPRITQQVDSRASVKLQGNTRPEANSTTYRGAVAASYPLEHILLFLQRSPQQERAVDAFITSLNDRKSANFHKWLSPEEYGEKFGVDDADIQQVTNWLESQGFQINQVYPNKIAIDFSGTAGQVSKAFNTEMAWYKVDGKDQIANANDPSVPQALAPVIRGFASLSSFRPNAMHMSASQYTFAGCSTTTTHPTGTGTCYAVTPEDNQTIYNLKPLFAQGIYGQGQTVAVVEDTNVYNYPGDWNTYRSTFGLNNYPGGSFIQNHPSCTDPGTNGDDGEAAIDVEVATGIAPGATIELMACPSGTLTFGGLIALQNRLNGAAPYPGVVSVSYGVCEAANGNGGNAAFYYTYQQAAAQGVSVFTSSGDEGPSACSRNFTNGAYYDVTSLGVTGWGGTPYDVSVGGTDFEDVYLAKFNAIPQSTYWSATNSTYYGSAKQYVPEIPWNDACASTLISNYVTASNTTYGTTGFCNTSPGNSTSGYLSTGAASGGASNCAIGQQGTNATSYLLSSPQCQGYAKPSYQTGSVLTGGQAVYGMNKDGLRNIPDISMFAANGAWNHYEVVCWSDPAYTSSGSAVCTGAPSTWSGFGGTSVSAPTMAAIQALVNQATGQNWGNPLPYYYQMGQNQYGTAGGSFLGASCDASGNGGPASGCVFNDVTQGDIDAACRYNGTVAEHQCYKPSGTNGVASTDVVTAATVLSGGTGYTSAPTCTIAGPTNASPYKAASGATLYAGGSQATCTASVNSGSTTAVWTVQPTAGAAGMQIVLADNTGTTTCGPYTLSGTTATALATSLNNAIGTGCALATSSRATSTVTITARNSGYAGNFTTNFTNNGTLFQAGYVAITNTTRGQGPNYVSGITIVAGGSGYQPEAPMTLTGGGGTGAVAVANTSPASPATTYQPAYGAGPGYDLATGLGTPNAYNFVHSNVWPVSNQPCPITFPNPGTKTYGVAPFALTATDTCSLPITYTVDLGPATVSGSTITITGAGSVQVTASQPGDSTYAAASQTITFTVNPAPVTATAGSGSHGYDGATHSPSACVVTGAYTGDLACTNSPASAGPNAGTTTITPNVTGTGLSNYAITPVNGSYTIIPATLTVTAGNGMMMYGATPPSISYTASGWVNGEGPSLFNPAPTCSPNVTSSTPPGTYASSCSGAAAPNYTMSYVNGTVTITKGKVTVTITSHSPNPSTHGQGVSVSFTVTAQTSGTPTGSVTITASTGQTCTGALSGGSGSCVITLPTAGNINLSPFYTGDSTFSAGPGTAVIQKVN